MSTSTEGDLVARIVGAAFARPLLVALAATLGVLLGADALRGLPRDVFPDLSTPLFSVIVQNPSMSAEELEADIAVPMESALAGLPGVRRIRSTSALGVTQVVVEFDPDASYATARQGVVERVAQAELPPGTDPPLISSVSGRLNEIFEFTIEAEPGAADLMTLRDLAEFDVRQRLLAVQGVGAVEVLGGYLREFQVQIDPDRMSARHVTLDDVLHAVEGANVNAAGGILVTGPTEWAVRAVGQVGSTADLRTTTVGLRGPVPVLLGDVADVVEAPAVRRGIAHRLDGEVVSCRVSKQFGADTVHVAAGLRAAIADLKLPEGVALRVVYDQSELVDASLGGLTRAVGIGALFVALVLFALLGDVRAATLVTLSIPASLALAGLLLERWGIGLNTMTLGGLAIAVGLLVDASIIVCENVVHRLVPGQSAAERAVTAERAAVEVGRPILFATLIVVAVFLPLFAMSGIEGRTYRPLAAAVIAAMAASLALAVSVTPLVSARLLRAHPGDGDNGLVRLVKRLYAPLLDAALARPWRVVAVSAAIAVPALLGATQLGRDFMPELDEGAFLVQTFLPAEASLDEVDRLNHGVEDALRGVPEVVEVVRRTGRAERTEDPMPHTVSDILVLLSPGGRPRHVVEEDVRERLEHVPAIVASITTPLGMRIDEGLGGTPADLSIRIFGPDLDVLSALAADARERLEDVPGLDDLRVEELTGFPQVRVAIDRDAVARVGLTPGDVVDALRIGLVGEEVSRVRLGQRRHALVVKLRDDRRDDLDALRGLLVDGHDGSRIPLGKLARIESTTGPGAIRREAGSRRIAVEASVVGRDLASTAAEVTERLQDLPRPTGYFVDVGGRAESEARASAALLRAMIIALVAVFVLLYLALDSVRETLVILATLPIALVGGVVALAITGETWNVSSLVGLIGLFGIAVQNGLVLVTQTRGLLATGLPLRDALRQASLGRVRPKLMTAGTAILGLLPMLVLDLHGTEIERPLAIVMTGGLLTSTAFVLLALPAFTFLFARSDLSTVR